MKATLSLTAIVAAIVLAIGVPSALGGGRRAEAPQSKAVAYFHANELRTAAASALPAAQAVAYFHANELRTAAASALPAAQAVAYFRANELRTAAAGASSSDAAEATGSDSSIERYVVGVLGIGVALGFGLLLVVRVRWSKSIAQ